MDMPREQYDELLGGKEELPSAVSIIKFANARSQEISALTEAIEEPQNKHLAFQRMAKHLRRRAMSHNVKRMPRRLREIHFSQLERSGLPVKGKRPSRKYRRRPCRLRDAYSRRQSSAVWLETHLWHAKRFHMTQLWGYRLPLAPTEKSFRACYRATARHCLLQDVSYLNCVELRGPEAQVLEPLRRLTSPDCGLTFAAKSSLAGSREGSVEVFNVAGNAIGKVSFMWRPETVDEKRTLWIWAHPAFYQELVQELISVFQFTTEMDIDPNPDQECKETPAKRQKVEEVKLLRRKLVMFSNENVEMALLKDALNRFRLTGPLAQVVLTEALKFVDINSFMKPEAVMDVEGEETPCSAWLTDFYSDQTRLDNLKLQRSFWEKVLSEVNSADELPRRMVLSTTVMDPRLSMPSKRIKAVNTGVIEAPLVSVPEGLSESCALWDVAVRNRVSHSQLSAARLNCLRSRALVPGSASPAWLGLHNVSHLPLLLIQNPGFQGFGSGWDVVVPAGWGMAVWLGLVYRGARSGALRDSARLALETDCGFTLPPDTAAGRLLAQQSGQQRLDRHFRLPPDKRPNFAKLGVVAPFFCPWETLLKAWCPKEESQKYYVIRNLRQLAYLRTLLSGGSRGSETAGGGVFNDQDLSAGLVQVKLEMCGRGTVKESAMICALSKRDAKNFSKEKSGRGPSEPIHKDENEEKRKTLRDAHLAKLKRLRKKRIRVRREAEEKGVFAAKMKNKKSPTEEFVKKQADRMRELWLPSEMKGVKDSASRSVVGFVVYGDYSFTRARCLGYGFVALSSLLQQCKQCLVLVRNVNSSQYFYATLRVL